MASCKMCGSKLDYSNVISTSVRDSLDRSVVQCQTCGHAQLCEAVVKAKSRAPESEGTPLSQAPGREGWSLNRFKQVQMYDTARRVKLVKSIPLAIEKDGSLR